MAPPMTTNKRKTKNSIKSRIYADRAIRAGRNATLVEICKGMYDAYVRNNNRLPYGHVQELLKQFGDQYSWLTRNIINKAFIKYRKDIKLTQKTTVPSEISLKSTSSSQKTMSTMSSSSLPSRSIGRPVGSTDEKKQVAKKKLIHAKNEIARKFAAVKKSTKRGKCMRKGQLEAIIQEVKVKNDIDSEISPSAIRRRLERNSLQSHHVAGGQISPLLRMEPTVVEIILQMARIRQCLTPSKGLQLVNSLISGTKLQQELIAWKRRGNTNNEEGLVGRGYWRKFMKRNRDKIVSKRGQKYELNRQNWTTYSNFVHMYDHCIQEMIEAGVAKELDKPVWMDRYGNVCNEDDAFGCKVFHQLVRPDMCICGDEVGGNISMKGDGHAGGQLMLVERGQVPMKKISTNNKKFTLIGLTALTGEPVMCVLIIEGKRPNPSIEAGIDIRVSPTGSFSDNDFLLKNCGNGKYFPGGPECTFRGKKVPAFIRWHESASITSEILVEMLQTIDALDLFPRKEGVKPFLLLDGHGSRLQLPFLQYINKPKDYWVVCIGVPYGTALWQVGDSKEQNGSFNIAMTKAKDELLSFKESIGLSNGITPTDMMPIINDAWKKSFARVNMNKNAISDRGWNPLNRALLLNDELRATMTAKESTQQYSSTHNILIPHNKLSSTPNNNDSSTTSTETDDNSERTLSNNLPLITDALNTTVGTAGDCMKALISSKLLQETRERIKEDMQKGKTIKEELMKATRITASIVIKAGSFRLSQDVFEAHKETEKDKRNALIEKLKNEEERYNKYVKAAEKVWEVKEKVEDMTIKELTDICRPLKRKDDGPMPKKKTELIAKYKEWYGRPVPTFNVANDEIVTLLDVQDNNEYNDETGINEIVTTEV